MAFTYCWKVCEYFISCQVYINQIQITHNFHRIDDVTVKNIVERYLCNIEQITFFLMAHAKGPSNGNTKALIALYSLLSDFHIGSRF